MNTPLTIDIGSEGGVLGSMLLDRETIPHIDKQRPLRVAGASAGAAVAGKFYHEGHEEHEEKKMNHAERKTWAKANGYRRIINRNVVNCLRCRHSDIERGARNEPLTWCNKFMLRVSQMCLCNHYKKKHDL